MSLKSKQEDPCAFNTFECLPPAFTLTGLAMALACSDIEPAGAEAADIEAQTVNAADGWAFVAFQGENAAAVSVNDRAASELWDLGFFATSVMLNGGAAGPAGVVGHCLCQNASATDGEVVAMTAESELAVFESVTDAQIPTAEGAWQSDALAAAIDGWYSYDPVTHMVSAVRENAWKIRTARGNRTRNSALPGWRTARSSMRVG
jgi:hypothetical protein